MELNTSANNSKLSSNTYFINNFNYLLTSKDIKCIDLAGIIGCPPEQLYYLKTGKLSNPSLRVLVAIKEHFSVSIDDLIFKDISKATVAK